jgi:hypothetical protein
MKCMLYHFSLSTASAPDGFQFVSHCVTPFLIFPMVAVTTCIA